MNTIVNMFPAKVKEDNDALVRYFVERKLVIREIVKSSSSFKNNVVNHLVKNCVNHLVKNCVNHLVKNCVDIFIIV